MHEYTQIAIMVAVALVAGIALLLTGIIIDWHANRRIIKLNRELREKWERDSAHAKANGLPPVPPPLRWVRGP